MKQPYSAPICEIFELADNDILTLSEQITVASFNDGPSIGFDLFK